MAGNELKEGFRSGKDEKVDRPDKEAEQAGKEKLNQCAQNLLGDRSSWNAARKSQAPDHKKGEPCSKAESSLSSDSHSFPELEIVGQDKKSSDVANELSGSARSQSAELLAYVNVVPEIEHYETLPVDPDWQGDGQNPTDEQSKAAHDLLRKAWRCDGCRHHRRSSAKRSKKRLRHHGLH